MNRLFVLPAFVVGLLLASPVRAAAPSGDFRKHETRQYFTKAVNIDAALTAATIVPNAATKLTIASGVITATQSSHTVETQSAASTDDLDTINGGTAEQLLIIRPFSDSHDVVIKHATGNIECPGAADLTLAEDDDFAVLLYTGSKWSVVGRKIKAETSSVSNGSVTGPKIATTFIQPFAIEGLDLGAGSATDIPCTGAQVGDAVVFIAKVTGTGPISMGNDDFEATITTNGQIKQTSLTDLEGVQYFGFLLKRQ